MRRMVLFLVVAMLVAAAYALPALAAAPQSEAGGCNGLIKAAEKSGNEKVETNAIVQGCIGKS